MKYLILIILLLCSCLPKQLLKQDEFVVTDPTELAIYQTDVYNNFSASVPISKITLDSLENNIWVATAYSLAPSNLVIRQYALIDLIKHKPQHKSQIKHLLNTLSGSQPSNRIWLEGYSYWVYTCNILDKWLITFNNPEINLIVRDIDMGFVCTAYLNPVSSLWLPAPFGDLRENFSLAPHLQEEAKQKNEKESSCEILNVNLSVSPDSIVYTIAPAPVGLNDHTPKTSSIIKIKDGYPIGFKWYTGMKNKY